MRGVEGKLDQLVVKLTCYAVIRKHAARVLVAHGDGAVDKVAEDVGQIGIDSLAEQLVGQSAVAGKGHLVEQIVSDCVNAEQVDQMVGIDDIAAGFGHFVFAHHQPGVTEYLLGELYAQSHQHNGPVDGVESENILADEVDVGGPVFFELLAVLSVHVKAGECDVVAQCVDPYVDDVTGRKLNGNAPCEGGAGYAQILQAGTDEVVEHFVLSGFGLDELGVILDVFFQHGSVLGELEEVCFFS